MKTYVYTKDVVHDLDVADVENGIRDRDRVRNNAEVFTNPREVNAMLDLIGEGPINIYKTHLEPSCGNGAFLTEIIRRKMAWIDQQSNKNDVEKMVVIAVASIYGIDISLKNIVECKERVYAIVEPYLTSEEAKNVVKMVIDVNIVVGNFLKSTGGILINTGDWKKLKPIERKMFEIENMDDENVHFIHIPRYDIFGFKVEKFSLRNMKTIFLGNYSMGALPDILCACNNNQYKEMVETV